jgi:predicted MarR family transcription regulator
MHFGLVTSYRKRAGLRSAALAAFSRIDIKEIEYTKLHARIMTKESLNMTAEAARDQSRWTFLTNHLHVLACLARDPELRIRDIADLIGITERATVQILNQLEASGYLTRTRVGRRNHYTVHGELPLRHPMHNGRQVGEILRVIEPEIPPSASRSRRH